MEIIIGADELILWLRKNSKAVNIPNDGFNGLGMRIYELICNQLNGVKIGDDLPSYWSIEDHPRVGKFELPKTSAQYQICTSRLNSLYTELSTW